MILSAMSALAAGLPARAQDAPTAARGDILDEWATVQAPPAPDVAPVRLDPRSTALLILDMQTLLANPGRPRAAAAIPVFSALLARARAAGVFVAYSTIPTGSSADIVAQLGPAPGDPVVSSGVDKFFNTDLDAILKSHGIQTVIVTGTVANGAVLFTASGAALRGYKVVVPVDCMPGGDPYSEQFTAWQLVNGPGTRYAARLVRSAGILF